MLRIRTLSLGAAALALSTASALAADLTYEPAPAPAIIAAPVGFSWTGPYVGAIVGYGWANFDGTSGYVDGGSQSGSGAKLGLYGGYNFQLDNNVVLGAEVDANWDDVSGNSDFVGTVRQNWDSTVRARAGYSFGRVMAYGTGGLAVSGAKVETGPYSDSATHVGWTVGAGLEGAVTDNITARLEYQYADFNKQDYNIVPGVPVSGDFNTNTVRAGLGYKF